jgi:hypothetical protein
MQENRVPCPLPGTHADKPNVLQPSRGKGVCAIGNIFTASVTENRALYEYLIILFIRWEGKGGFEFCGWPCAPSFEPPHGV